jgi:transcriptional regulator with XRE-family HTH domain
MNATTISRIPKDSTNPTSPPAEQLQETAVVARLREHSFNRADAYLAHQDAVADHHRVRAEYIDDLVDQLNETSAVEILAELRQRGLLWSKVAEIVGVTETAVRKWRKGAAIDLTHRHSLGRLAALGHIYEEWAMPGGPTAFGEWLDSNIVSHFSATPTQLLALNREADVAVLQPLLDWMLGEPDATQAERLLDQYLGARWRNDAQQEQRFRIVTNGAGERILLVES